MAHKLKIPSLEKIKESINYFQTVNWSSLENYSNYNDHIKKLDEYLIEKLGIIPWSTTPYNTSKFPVKTYRLRKFDETINAKLISEFSHPPASFARTPQRANLPFHPAFYCSPSAKTAVFETLENSFEPEKENWYYLSEWSFRENEPLNISSFIFGKYEFSDFFNSLSEKSFLKIKEKIPDISEGESESLREILFEYSNLFEQKENYLISSFIGHNHLYPPHNMRADIFMYPSIQSFKGAMNFAIHPNAVIHKLILNRVYLFKVKSYSVDENTKKMTLPLEIEGRVGINNNHGYLTWINMHDEDFVHFKKLLPETND